MLARCYSGAVSGVEAQPVEIEVNSVVATSTFAIVGLPDQAVREAKDRVSTALKNSGFKAKEEFAVTVNLAPADVKKEGPIYDLPIAVALLKATQRLRTERLSEYATAAFHDPARPPARCRPGSEPGWPPHPSDPRLYPAGTGPGYNDR